jgi:hypothetical protein
VFGSGDFRVVERAFDQGGDDTGQCWIDQLASEGVELPDQVGAKPADGPAVARLGLLVQDVAEEVGVGRPVAVQRGPAH